MIVLVDLPTVMIVGVIILGLDSIYMKMFIEMEVYYLITFHHYITNNLYSLVSSDSSQRWLKR